MQYNHNSEDMVGFLIDLKQLWVFYQTLTQTHWLLRGGSWKLWPSCHNGMGCLTYCRGTASHWFHWPLMCLQTQEMPPLCLECKALFNTPGQCLMKLRSLNSFLHFFQSKVCLSCFLNFSRGQSAAAPNTLLKISTSSGVIHSAAWCIKSCHYIFLYSV